MSRAPLWLLMLSVAVIGANSLALGPIAPAIAQDLDLDVPKVMWAAAAYGLATAVGALTLAALIDRVGALKSLAMALTALTLALAAAASAPGLGLLIGSQVVAGLAAGVALPSAYAAAVQFAAKGQENRTLGRVLIGWTLSLVAGVTLSALVADHLGWRAVFAGLAGVSGIVFVGLIARMHRDPPPAPTQTGGSVQWPLASRSVKGVIPLLFMCFSFMTAFYGVYGYVGAHITGALNLPLRSMAFVALSYGAGFGLAAGADQIIDRIGARRALPVALGLIAAVYASLGIGAAAFPALVALSFVWGAVNHTGLTLIVSSLGALSAERRGAILGLNSAVTYVAASAGALSGGSIYLAGGFSGLAILAAILMALTAAGAIWWNRTTAGSFS